MPTSRAQISTASASRYLQQLCKHWGHRLPVEFTTEKGSIRFDDNRALALTADPATLTLTLEVNDEAELVRTQGVVIDHLKRFAFREDLGDVPWTRQ